MFLFILITFEPILDYIFEVLDKFWKQLHPQGFFGVQNGSLEKTLANSGSGVSKNVGDFDCFKLTTGSMIG